MILGAGLAGLSAAYHLKKDPSAEAEVFEKSDKLGGTARSIRVNGFTFDITGHLLHLHFPYTQNLIRELLGDNIYTCERKAAIYSNGVTTPYPFQVNTYGLPKKVVKECVDGFRDAVKKYSDDKSRSTSLPFSVWSERTFGKGLTKHFMKPYNEKLWQVKNSEMTAEWCGMFVPQPKLEEVVQGSKKRSSKAFGYNATFLYPQKGGIQVLAEALGKGLPVRLKTSMQKVNWKDKKVQISDGEWKPYDRMVSTLPLTELLDRMEDLPKEILEIRKQLRCTSVINVNLGIARANISDKSWIYFPEKKFVFYRVGFPMNFTPHAVPKGCSSMYVEVSHPVGKKPKLEGAALLSRIRKDLEACKILRPSDKIITTNVIPVKHAYVIYIPQRKKFMETVFDFLHGNGIDSIGRYGEWKYSFMEEAMMDGKKTAEKILSA